jgi:hypothetical protein
MKGLAVPVLGSVVTAGVVSLLFALVRRRRGGELPAYWLGFISALLWFPAFVWSWLKPIMNKDPGMPVFDWVVAAICMLPVLGFWSLFCSIPVRIVGAGYDRLRNKKPSGQSRS